MGEFIGQVVIGMFEVLLGRRLFWLFAAIGGFLIGWCVLDAIFDLGWWARLVIGIILAIGLAVFSHKRTKPAVAIAGFVVFGAVAVVWFGYIGVDVTRGNGPFWAVFLVAGAVAAVLLTFFFDKALIALSSLSGAGATAKGIDNLASGLPKWVDAVIAVILLGGGVVYQMRSMKRHGDKLIPIQRPAKAKTKS